MSLEIRSGLVASLQMLFRISSASCDDRFDTSWMQKKSDKPSSRFGNFGSFETAEFLTSPRFSTRMFLRSESDNSILDTRRFSVGSIFNDDGRLRGRGCSMGAPERISCQEISGMISFSCRIESKFKDGVLTGAREEPISDAAATGDAVLSWRESSRKCSHLENEDAGRGWVCSAGLSLGSSLGSSRGLATLCWLEASCLFETSCPHEASASIVTFWSVRVWNHQLSNLTFK